jgi:hypothetical protein
MSDENIVKAVVVEAIQLREQYGEDVLQGLLEAEFDRLTRERGAKLGDSTAERLKQIAPDVALPMLDAFHEHQAFTDTFVAMVVNNVVAALAQHGYIATTDLAVYQFIIAVITAMTLDVIHKEYQRRRQRPVP